MTKRSKTDPTQSELFQPWHARQRATVSPERESLYAAILKLRRRGLAVYRVSATQHRVGDKLLSPELLKWLADGFPGPG